MVRCPNCDHEEVPGSLFCTECGARLTARSAGQPEPLQRFPRPQKKDVAARAKEERAKEARTVPLATAGFSPGLNVWLVIMQTGERLPLVGRTEFTLGRVTEGQPLIPEIDLSAYKAYDQGVSRLHAVLTIHTDKVSITDLGSANGTWLNGVRLPPHAAHTLKTGDLISLGTMKIQAIVEQ